MTAPEKRPDGGFAAFVLDQLAGLNGVSSRAMFGGRGLYFKGLFFGILFRGRVYFKTGPENREDYRGMPSFRPNARQTLKNYYEVPAEVVEEADELQAWAVKAARARPEG
ncbi:MAG: TfoX/Sxy family protein [Nitrospinaceae bacterium]|nr:MAG: TfoX/Sxy family protein [Nitrospinaceae bacterium]